MWSLAHYRNIISGTKILSLFIFGPHSKLFPVFPEKGKQLGKTTVEKLWSIYSVGMSLHKGNNHSFKNKYSYFN